MISGDGWNEIRSNTWTEICGDGKRFNTILTYWDDGNNVGGDGWNCTGGSATTLDTWTEISGDGKQFNTILTYWDDGNNVGGDGCSNTWAIETGWTCTGGSATTLDTWTEICGDGKQFNTILTYWDDGNNVGGDGCSNTWAIETGWTCTGGSATTLDTWTESCGDGKRFNTILTYWDDGNNVGGDGCSNTWAIETGWTCTGGSATTLDTWTEICRDGKRFNTILTYWDDGNNVGGDWCSNTWAIDTGWTFNCGLNSSPCVCFEKCGDGITFVHNSVKWDDGNTVSDDGCSMCMLYWACLEMNCWQFNFNRRLNGHLWRWNIHECSWTVRWRQHCFRWRLKSNVQTGIWI